jgi:hypothetical protein
MESSAPFFTGLHMQCASDVFTAHEIGDARTPEPPLVVHLTRMAGLLTLLGGMIMLIAGNAGIGVAIILLSALYVALAEIIRYLAMIRPRLRLSRGRDE